MIIENPLLRGTAISLHAHVFYEPVDQYDAPQPTTCCYQHVHTNVGKYEKVQVHSYFPMSTFGVAHCVFDHWTNIFLGGAALHGMSILNFYVDNGQDQELFVSEHHALNLMAWGEG